MAFKASPVKGDMPFIVWLLVGMSAWNYFADGLVYATSAITGNSFLVKKASIRLSLMPLVRILSAMAFHIMFLSITVVFLFVYGVTPTVYWLQILYYLPAMILLMLSLGWVLSAISVFTRDVDNALGVVIQFGFWLTPIFWSMEMIPDKYHWVVKLNPVFYIVRGYRDTFLDGVWFWERAGTTIYYWAVVLILMGAGALVFKRLRSHFADVI